MPCYFYYYIPLVYCINDKHGMMFFSKIYTFIYCLLTVTSSAMRVPSIIKGLMWRSALKHFAPIQPHLVQIEPILEAARLAPSSFGLQPYNIHVVTNKDVKSKLREVSYNQTQ